MNLSDLETNNARDPICPADICTYASKVWPTAIKFGTVTTWGRHVSRGQPRPRHKRAGPECSPIVLGPHTSAYTVLPRTTKFGILNNPLTKNRHILRSNILLHLRGTRTNILEPHIRPHRITQSNQILQGDLWRPPRSFDLNADARSVCES